MNYTLIDTHCHLNYEFDNKTPSELIKEANMEGIEYLISISTEVSTLDDIIKISESHPCVFFSSGTHPHDTSKMKENDLKIIKEKSKHKKCLAIGEIGLDYHYLHSPKDIQIKRLRDQLNLALEVNLPVVIHSRKAEEDLLIELKEYAKKSSLKTPGVIHCFSGTREFAFNTMNIGFYISFSGILTVKKSDDLREIAKEIPLDKILIETDAPFLAPVPFRGKKCEPKMVKETAKILAKIKEKSFEEIANKTSENAKNFFKIPV